MIYLFENIPFLKSMIIIPCAKYSKAEIIKDIKIILNRILIGKCSRSMQVFVTYLI